MYMMYIHDENGAVNGIGLWYPGDTEWTYYYFVKNLQGDILEIYSENHNCVASYTYDSWGNILSKSGSLADINPFRYRGYYFDTETWFYYLQSRYYDPAIGRFINADILTSTGQGILGNNMFAYCNNSPINNVDSSGTAAETILDLLSLGTSIIDVASNPSDPWAWAGLAGDIVDVAIPFFGGVGETVKATSAALKVADAADDLHDASKVVEGFCFVAGTAVLTSSGNRAIETIQSGDYVWAWDETTGDVALKEVVETYVNQTDELIHVFVNGEEIITTPAHPFYSPVKGWTEAVKLRAGDILVLVNGKYVVVEKVQHEILEAPVTVYNFQVEDYHTYYVANGVLVHNSCSNNFKRIDPEYFEKANDLAKGTFHRQVKPTILKAEKPDTKLVGNNPDILMNRNGRIAYQNVRNKKKLQLTELLMEDILNRVR